MIVSTLFFWCLGSAVLLSILVGLNAFLFVFNTMKGSGIGVACAMAFHVLGGLLLSCAWLGSLVLGIVWLLQAVGVLPPGAAPVPAT